MEQNGLSPLFEEQEVFWEPSLSNNASNNGSNNTMQDDAALPQFDNSIFKHMQGNGNCLMTNQTKKVRAYVPKPYLGDEYEMSVICTEKLLSNFDELFPRSMGIGRFNERGVFSLPFSQQTTSNNKKKGKPYLQFAIQFRGPRVQFQSEWFYTVCQNTRAKKRFRKETKDDSSPPNHVPEFVHPLPILAEAAAASVPKKEEADFLSVILKMHSGDPAGRLRLLPYWTLGIVRDHINRDLEFIDLNSDFSTPEITSASPSIRKLWRVVRNF
jgi:hypothetical protein